MLKIVSRSYVSILRVGGRQAQFFSVPFYFFSEGVPYDGVPQNITVSVHPAVTTIFGFVSIAGMVFAVICVVFNLVFHKKP